MAFNQFTNLDFYDIRTQIKDYLRGNSNFSDFDFEGSNFSILIDTLAYNSYITAYNTNMAINESSHLTPSSTFPPPPCTHPSPPPIPIIHSTFPPPQGASYLPLDQSLQAPNQESLQEWLHPCYQNSFQQQQ